MRLLPITLTALLLGCGAKTGLALEDDAGPPVGMDAGVDAGTDGGFDAGIDAPMCVPGVVPLVQGRVEAVFVIDRSGSMAATFDGRPATAGLPSRWEILQETMRERLSVFDDNPNILAGGKFFPWRSIRPIMDSCAIRPGLETPLGSTGMAGIVNEFTRFGPAGGTPVAPATQEALDALLDRADENAAQFIVIATDGAPTCSRDATAETVEVVTRAHEENGIDVYVIGIASTGPEVALLNQLAIIGGRPRPATEANRFYDASDPAALDALLGDIARDLTQCVFEVPIPPGPDDDVQVIVAGEVVARDTDRLEGWDWTSIRRSQLSLFGAACEQAIATGGAVRADITCAP